MLPPWTEKRCYFCLRPPARASPGKNVGQKTSIDRLFSARRRASLTLAAANSSETDTRSVCTNTAKTVERGPKKAEKIHETKLAFRSDGWIDPSERPTTTPGRRSCRHIPRTNASRCAQIPSPQSMSPQLFSWARLLGFISSFSSADLC